MSDSKNSQTINTRLSSQDSRYRGTAVAPAETRDAQLRAPSLLTEEPSEDGSGQSSSMPAFLAAL